MANITKTTGRIAEVRRLNNSASGNPRYKFITEDGVVVTTAKDAADAYEIVPSNYVGRIVELASDHAGAFDWRIIE